VLQRLVCVALAASQAMVYVRRGVHPLAQHRTRLLRLYVISAVIGPHLLPRRTRGLRATDASGALKIDHWIFEVADTWRATKHRMRQCASVA
jgi:hypothetical protein